MAEKPAGARRKRRNIGESVKEKRGKETVDKHLSPFMFAPQMKMGHFRLRLGAKNEK